MTLLRKSTAPDSSDLPSRFTSVAAALVLVLLLAAFWTQVVSSGLAKSLGHHVGVAFLSFALMLSVLWFFGFGASVWIRERLTTPLSRILGAALLSLPYVIFSVPRHEFRWTSLFVLIAIACLSSALVHQSRGNPALTCADGSVMIALAVILETRMLSPLWPYHGLGAIPKLYLADVALYAFLVVRPVGGMGYSFVPRWSAFRIGVREWLFFFPIAMLLGFALHFIHFVPRVPSPGHVTAALLFTFLLTAVPEELFFRGILQNLLEGRVGQNASLLITSLMFGLSHFHKGAAFNWRYVIMATVAGVFYGRAWRERRQLLASSTTHTLVDVVWSLWFR